MTGLVQPTHQSSNIRGSATSSWTVQFDIPWAMKGLPQTISRTAQSIFKATRHLACLFDIVFIQVREPLCQANLLLCKSTTRELTRAGQCERAKGVVTFSGPKSKMMWYSLLPYKCSWLILPRSNCGASFPDLADIGGDAQPQITSKCPHGVKRRTPLSRCYFTRINATATWSCHECRQ